MARHLLPHSESLFSHFKQTNPLMHSIFTHHYLPAYSIQFTMDVCWQFFCYQKSYHYMHFVFYRIYYCSVHFKWLITDKRTHNITTTTLGVYRGTEHITGRAVLLPYYFSSWMKTKVTFWTALIHIEIKQWRSKNIQIERNSKVMSPIPIFDNTL